MKNNRKQKKEEKYKKQYVCEAVFYCDVSCVFYAMKEPNNGHFHTRRRIVHLDKLVWLCGTKTSIKMGTRRIICLDELSFEVRHPRSITKNSSSRRIMHLEPVFILETHNQTNYKSSPKFVQMDNASSSCCCSCSFYNAHLWCLVSRTLLQYFQRYFLDSILPFFSSKSYDVITNLICTLQKCQYLWNEKKIFAKRKTPFFCTLKGLSNKQKIFFMSYTL